MALFGGTSTAATGAISNGTASLLSFPDRVKQYTMVSNNSGAVAYFRLNSVTVSATEYDFKLADAGVMPINDVEVSSVGVFVAGTAGIRIVGWNS